MKRFTSSVSQDLFLIMVSFGILIGLILPFFTQFVLQLPSSQVLNLTFFIMCVTAGIIVGIFKFSIFRLVVYRFLREMRSKINEFREKLNKYYWDRTLQCLPEECHLDMASADVIGSLVEDFNHFIDTIYHLIKTEHISSEFMENLKKSLKINDVAEIIIQFFRDYFGGDAAAILTYERGQFNITKTWNLELAADKINTDYWFRVLREGRVILLKDVAEDFLAINIGLGKLKPKHIAYIPLVYQTHDVGIVILLSRTPFRKDFQSLESQNIISEATPFLYNALLMKRLELLAAIDELTGVLNRRFGMRRLKEELERSKRYGLPLSVGMIDIDDFKKINDTYGHQCGDLILKTLAELISQNIRVSDFVIRYGGEEFLVVVPGASSLDAMKIMERLRQAVSTLAVHYGGYELHFTFSGGIATFPSDIIRDLGTLVQKADQAFYQAKKSGKNRVIIGG